MKPDFFDAEVHLELDRSAVWDRLTGRPADAEHGRQLWLPGFDAAATVQRTEEGTSLEAIKDDEPCRGTKIVVTLSDHESGTMVRVVQSGFGDWLADLYDAMEVGWRQIVDDLATYLATGVNARRHRRPWPDFGAGVAPDQGGLMVAAGVREGSLADRLGLEEGDLLIGLADAPISSTRDLDTALRVIDSLGGTPTVEWIRDGRLHGREPPSVPS